MFKVLKYLVLFWLIITILALWNYLKLIARSPYFYRERGLADIRSIPIKFSGGNGKYYTAEIPKNYLFMDKQELSGFTGQKISTKVPMWTAYPSFKGYFPGEQVDNWIFFGLTQADYFSESQLQARLGQKGVRLYSMNIGGRAIRYPSNSLMEILSSMLLSGNRNRRIIYTMPAITRSESSVERLFKDNAKPISSGAIHM
jgi:hypothetical protein